MSLKIDDIFNGAEGGTLTLEQFQTLAKEKGANFVDLSGGDYISVRKHNSEIDAKDEQIDTLNSTLSERDKDLAELQEQLKNAGNDAEKLSTVSADLTALQAKYEEDTKSFQAQLDRQARDFAIKEYAATKKFTSTAAKRDYIANMQNSEDVKMSKKGELLGLKDFDDAYSKENEDAFVKEESGQESNPAPAGNEMLGQPYGSTLPMFAQPTPGESKSGPDNKESFGFSFIPQAQT